MLQGGLSEAEQDSFLTADPAQVLAELGLHPPLGPGPDLVDDVEEQLDEGVGDLAGA